MLGSADDRRYKCNLRNVRFISGMSDCGCAIFFIKNKKKKDKIKSEVES